MKHDIHCPNCSQHIILDIPDRGPVELKQPVRVYFSNNDIFWMTGVVCFSLVAIGFGVVVVGVLLIGLVGS